MGKQPSLKAHAEYIFLPECRIRSESSADPDTFSISFRRATTTIDFFHNPLLARVAIWKILFSLLLFGSFSPERASAADKLRISNCFIGGAVLPLWMAKDAR